MHCHSLRFLPIQVLKTLPSQKLQVYAKFENSELENSDFLKLVKRFVKSVGEFSNFTNAEVKSVDSDWTQTVFQVGPRSPRGQSFQSGQFIAIY